MEKSIGTHLLITEFRFFSQFMPQVYKMKHLATQSGLFGNRALGKYWTEHMLGYLTQPVGLNVLPNMLGCFKSTFVHNWWCSGQSSKYSI